MQPSQTFLSGDLALLKDARGRQYLITLESDGTFQCHLGFIKHDQIIDSQHGSWIETNKNHLLFAQSPSFADAVTLVNRGTQIIYPKDLGLIVNIANLQSGDNVIEAGLGSGILTSAILRCIGTTGHVTSYEINEDIIPLAKQNIRILTNGLTNFTIKQANINRSLSGTDMDSIILDLPEPWKLINRSSKVLKPGGRLVCFLPTILQVHKLTSALHENILFTSVQTTETLQREWHVTKNSARPSHRMIGHTGFITVAIRCLPRHPN
tara:strand:+ start:3661 stop:4458 length:798 start_codon:yes stop_codon:yes gene_type:complete